MTKLYVGSSDKLTFPCIVGSSTVEPESFEMVVTTAGDDAVTLLSAPAWSDEEQAYVIGIDPTDVPVDIAGSQWKFEIVWTYYDDGSVLQTVRDVVYADVVDDDASQARSYSSWATVKAEVRRKLEEPVPVVFADESLLSDANSGMTEIATELLLEMPVTIDTDTDSVMLPRYAITPLRDYILTRAFEQVGDWERVQSYRQSYEAGLARASRRAVRDRRVPGSTPVNVNF